MASRSIDRTFLIMTAFLVLFGTFIFVSASMGLLTREGPNYSSIIFNQFVFGLLLGGVFLFATLRIPYGFWKKQALTIFISAIVLNLLVFVPHVGAMHGGARRWIEIFGMSFQPSEALKIGFVIFFAAWLSAAKSKVATFKQGTLPLLILFAVVGCILLGQRDTDTYGVIIVTGLAMFVSSGGKGKHVAAIILTGLIALGAVVALRPYVLERVLTFINPARDPLGSGYQIQQSLIAIGSGRLFGRGFGQSIQKFNYLPEPMGDSIFAVAAEEFGFIGSALLVVFFVLFSLRGLKIAGRAPDLFSRNLVIGIIMLIITQSFLNIGAMVGVLPLSGTPLLFISQGGTALLFALAEVGIVLNVSKYTK